MIDVLYLTVISIKSILFYAIGPIDLSWMPFITTQFVNHQNVLEAAYLIDRNIQPYFTDNIFQKPILLYTLAMFQYRAYYLIVDIIVAELMAQCVGINQGYKKFIRIFYHVNPITFVSLLQLHTDGIDYVFLMLSVYLAQHQYKIAPLAFGFLIYLNPQYCILLSVIALLYRRTNNNNTVFIVKLLIHIIITVLTIIGLLYLSNYITNSWEFINKCYIDVYFPKDHKPTIGFLWALFSGLFTKYKGLYHALYMIFPLCYIIPFYHIFHKYAEKQLNFIGFMMGVTLYTSFLYFQQVNLMNILVPMMLFYQRYDLAYSNITAFGTSYPLVFFIMLAGGLQLLWTHSSSGNPNFPFFQIFVYFTLSVVLVTESLREMLKAHARNKLNIKDKTKLD